MATTLSLVVIFLPIAFMNGYAKRFINPFGWTMAFAILVSMLVSFTLTPMLSSRFLKVSDGAADQKTKEVGFFHWLDTWYTRQVNWALDHAGTIIAISVVTTLLTVPLNRMVGREFVPNEDMGEWTIHLDAPEGTSLQGTTEVAFQLVKELNGIEGVAQIEPSIGVSGVAGSPTHIHFLCQALPLAARKHTQAQIITEMRRRLAAHPSYRPSITSRNALGSGEGTGGFAISANILGPDLGQIADYSKRALVAAQKLPSLTEVKIGLNLSNPEVHVAVDRKRAADLGVRMATIGNILRLAVSGDDEISFYKEGPEQYPVKIRVLENQRRDIAEIGRLTVPSDTGPVRIDNIARLERGLGPSALQRSDRQFTVNLIADIAPGHALDEASNDVRRMLAGLNMPGTMSYKLQGQSKILDETTTNLIMAISLAMVFVYMVLASQFESFLQPIVIMLVLPISVPFALFTLWITGRTLNLWSALGMLLLLGIVKKNSILQVDYANVLRAQGLPLREAIVESCRTRLRPILMTTTAIIAGLIPTSIGHRHRRQRPRRDRRDDHRRAGAVPVPDAAAGAGRLREVRRARAGVDRGAGQGLAPQGVGGDVRPPATGVAVNVPRRSIRTGAAGAFTRAVALRLAPLWRPAGPADTRPPARSRSSRRPRPRLAGPRRRAGSERRQRQPAGSRELREYRPAGLPRQARGRSSPPSGEHPGESPRAPSGSRSRSSVAPPDSRRARRARGLRAAPRCRQSPTTTPPSGAPARARHRPRRRLSRSSAHEPARSCSRSAVEPPGRSTAAQPRSGWPIVRTRAPERRSGRACAEEPRAARRTSRWQRPRRLRTGSESPSSVMWPRWDFARESSTAPGPR